MVLHGRISGYLDHGFGRKIHHPNLLLGCLFFTGHVVFVGLQGGAWLGDGIDHPKVFDLAVVVAHERELFGIGRKQDTRPLAFAFIFFLLQVGLAKHAAVVAIMLLAIGGQLGFNDGGVLLFFHRLQEIGLVHPVEVVVFGKNHIGGIGRNASPGGFVLRLFVVFKEFEHARS